MPPPAVAQPLPPAFQQEEELHYLFTDILRPKSRARCSLSWRPTESNPIVWPSLLSWCKHGLVWHGVQTALHRPFLLTAGHQGTPGQQDKAAWHISQHACKAEPGLAGLEFVQLRSLVARCPDCTVSDACGLAWCTYNMSIVHSCPHLPLALLTVCNQGGLVHQDQARLALIQWR
mmetsp:Transcript_1957/g.3586  ORF Transcript_1957/g.3586 Transcript_1957/m.3586 type:complete len:175 (+) Transcript_1957:90-614(+)